ncbi:MAG TPA: hypothetical protein VHZ01_03190 [Casimicrobiaceae bacterium]|jgi:hypothetical protein|nr:hypothetical protein [Casimicrobiaceae bacterium]
MKRRYLVQALFVASLGAFAATGYAQTNTTSDQTPGSPGAAVPAAGTGTSAGATTGTAGAGTYGQTTQTGRMRAPMTSSEIRAYEQARASCDNGPAAQRDQCWAGLTAQYSGVSPKCQKLTGNALDACIHQGAVADNAGK